MAVSEALKEYAQRASNESSKDCNLHGFDLDSAKAAVYLSQLLKDSSLVVKNTETALPVYLETSDSAAKETLLYYMQTSKDACAVVYGMFPTIVQKFLASELKTADFVGSSIEKQELSGFDNLVDLLSVCINPISADSAVVDSACKYLLQCAQTEYLKRMCLIISNQLPLLYTTSPEPFEVFDIKTVFHLLSKPQIEFVDAGLRLWLAFISNCPKLVTDNVVKLNKEVYFNSLLSQVSRGNKYALKILELTFDSVNGHLSSSQMEYNSSDQVCRSYWQRYICLIEILGIDTSLHQMANSMSDFVAILRPESPIPLEWKLALVNVGIIVSNTDSIRSYTAEMLLGMDSNSLESLAQAPKLVVDNWYPRFLRTNAFVVINGRCLHAEHLESFTNQFAEACFKMNTFDAFIRCLGEFFSLHAHAIEAPRVMILAAIKKSIDKHECKLSTTDTAPFVTASKAIQYNYHNKILAGLFRKFTEEIEAEESDLSDTLFRKQVFGEDARTDVSADTIQGPEYGKADKEQVERRIESELENLGFLTRETYNHLSIVTDDNSKLIDALKCQTKNPCTLIEALLPIQTSRWNTLDVDLVKKLLKTELNSPPTISSGDRILQAYAVETAVLYVNSMDFETCETIFEQYTNFYTRYAALKLLAECTDGNLNFDEVDKLWYFINDNGMKFSDRKIHVEFINLMSKQKCDCTSICEQLIEISYSQRFLLHPLAKMYEERAIQTAKTRNGGEWVLSVMVKIFLFISSNDNILQLEDIVMTRFESMLDLPSGKDAEARAIAGKVLFLIQDANVAENLALKTIKLANLKQKITGSLDNVEGHKRVLHYQALILLQKNCLSSTCLETLKSAIKSELDEEVNPLCRLHAEWLLALLVNHDENKLKLFENAFFDDLKPGNQPPPRVVSSIIRVAMLLYFGNRKQEFANVFLSAFVKRLIPCVGSNRAIVRHSSVAALYKLTEQGLVPEEFNDIVQDISELNKQGLQAGNYQFDTYLWEMLDTRVGPVCGGVCSTHYKRTMANTLTDSDFEPGTSIEIKGECWDPCSGTPNSELPLPNAIQAREDAVYNACHSNAADFSSHIQVKASASSVETRANRTDLIVLASLCDKPVNLGAICRLSDALGAKQLVVKDLRTLEDSNFKSTSLTAEKWLPIKEVPERELIECIKDLKMEGYYVVGIEQTDTSMTLTPNLKFPKKVALLMGHEKQGIPASILAQLDGCIIIEQRGYVRSMNIQTATAVVVHAYNTQHSPECTNLTYSSK